MRELETEKMREAKTRMSLNLSCALKMHRQGHKNLKQLGILFVNVHRRRYQEMVYDHIVEMYSESHASVIDLALDGYGYWRKVAVSILGEDDLDFDNAQYLYGRLNELSNSAKHFALWDLLSDYCCDLCDGYDMLDGGSHGIEMGSLSYYDPPEYYCETYESLEDLWE